MYLVSLVGPTDPFSKLNGQNSWNSKFFVLFSGHLPTVQEWVQDLRKILDETSKESLSVILYGFGSFGKASRAIFQVK